MMNQEFHGWHHGHHRMLGGILWLASLASLLAAWCATRAGTFWGIEPGAWYANALVLGVLAIPLKLKRWSSCECDGCTCEMPSKRR